MWTICLTPGVLHGYYKPTMATAKAVTGHEIEHGSRVESAGFLSHGSRPATTPCSLTPRAKKWISQEKINLIRSAILDLLPLKQLAKQFSSAPIQDFRSANGSPSSISQARTLAFVTTHSFGGAHGKIFI